MTQDDSSPLATPEASWSFDRKYMIDGKHSAMLFLPAEYHALIGRLIAYWGNFEVIFDLCLEALITGESANGKTRKTNDWKRKSFRQRRELFESICNEWLSLWQSTAAKELVALLQTAATLHGKRNLIAHGTYSYTVLPNSSLAADCYAFSHSTGERLHFDEEVLKELYHDISHLTADLLLLFKSFGKVKGPYLLIPDAEVLRIYHDTVHPWNPDPSKRPNAV